jgi:hypothetical protein
VQQSLVIRKLLENAIPIVLALFTALIGLFGPSLLVKEKKLAYFVTHPSPIVDKVAPGASEVTVLFGGVKVENPYFVEVTFENTGALEIEADDFKQPLEIEFVNRLLLGAPQVTSAPSNIKVAYDVRTSSRESTTSTIIRLTPTLLKKGEKIAVSLIVNGDTKDGFAKPKIAGRVKGVAKLEEQSYAAVWPYATVIRLSSGRVFAGLIVFLFIGFAVAVLLDRPHAIRRTVSRKVVYAIVVMIGATSTIFLTMPSIKPLTHLLPGGQFSALLAAMGAMLLGTFLAFLTRGSETSEAVNEDEP